MRLLGHVLVELREKVDHESRVKHLLNSLDLSALIEPQKDSLLIMIRHEWGVSFSDAIQSSLALSRIMDDVVNRKLPNFGSESSLELRRHESYIPESSSKLTSECRREAQALHESVRAYQA